MKGRKLNRLRGFDYSSDNLYFITCCVHNMVWCFGEIQSANVDNGINVARTGRDLSLPHPTDHRPNDTHFHNPRQKMILNEYGAIATQQWYWLENQYPYIVLHAFVVMPNHVHGIIEIKRDIIVGTGRDLSIPIDHQCNHNNALTGRDLSLPKIKSLSELMGAYKTTISKKIHLLGYAGFAWKRSFYEHIIRDERSFETISQYIVNNPVKWKKDKFFNP